MNKKQVPERHRMPGWVRGFVSVCVITLALLIVVMVTSGDDHGPSRHQLDTPAEPSDHVPPVDHG